MPKVYTAFRYYSFSVYFWPRHSEEPENRLCLQSRAITQDGAEGAALNGWASLSLIQSWLHLDWSLRGILADP